MHAQSVKDANAPDFDVFARSGALGVGYIVEFKRQISVKHM